MEIRTEGLHYYIGYSNNGDIRYRASSGGIGTAIIKYLLDSGTFGTAITFIYNKLESRYEAKLIYDFSEYNNCGSIYQDIDSVSFIRNNIGNIRNGIVLSCMPCQVKAIKNILDKNRVKSFVISFSCSGCVTLEGCHKYLNFIGIKDLSTVESVRYRGDGWPSGIKVILKNGNEIFYSNYSYPWNILIDSKFYTPKRCLFCFKDTSYTSDISLADPWLPYYKENEKVGATLFFANTELGMTIINDLTEKKIISYNISNYNDYSFAQAPNVLKQYRNQLNKRYYKFLIKLNNKKLYRKLFANSVTGIKLHNFLIKRIHFLFSQMERRDIINKVKNKLSEKYRYLLWKNRLGGHKGFFHMGRNLDIINPQMIRLGHEVRIGNGTYLGPIIHYADVFYKPTIEIGDNTIIGKNSSIAAINGVIIGNNVLFAGGVHITDHSHGYSDIQNPITHQALISKGPVIIEDDCWLGFSCEILSGVHIGKHSIVAARAVVTKDVPSFTIVAGNPAKVIKKYNKESKIWEKI